MSLVALGENYTDFPSARKGWRPVMAHCRCHGCPPWRPVTGVLPSSFNFKGHVLSSPP
jgi:hypothetical protein